MEGVTLYSVQPHLAAAVTSTDSMWRAAHRVTAHPAAVQPRRAAAVTTTDGLWGEGEGGGHGAY